MPLLLCPFGLLCCPNFKVKIGRIRERKIEQTAAIPSLSSDSQISSTAVAYSSSCISLEPPKQGGRHRDFIWLYFNDISPAKTSGHRKAQ
ncbi:unnamed protein product, partial [Rotaria magnacalcarata]